MHPELPRNESEPPYRHWHVICAACNRPSLARPCPVPGPIPELEHNPVIRCEHCGDSRQYLTQEVFLSQIIAVAKLRPERSGSAKATLAVMMGFFAGIRLAKVDSRELQAKSPRVRAAIADAEMLAGLVLERLRAKE